MPRTADLRALLLTGALLAACGGPAPENVREPVAERARLPVRERSHVVPETPSTESTRDEEPSGSPPEDPRSEAARRARPPVWEILDRDLEVVARSQNDDGSWG